MASRFYTKKWVFDKKALATSRKAHDILDHAKDRLMATGFMDYPGNWIDLTLETRDALGILEAAGKKVGQAFDEANKAAASK